MSIPLLELLTESVSPGHSLLFEYADTLAQVAAALQLRDVRPAAMVAASLAAAGAAQSAQDEEGAAFEASTQLTAQVAAAQRALEQLEGLAAALDAAAGPLQEETRARTDAAAAKRDKTRKYEEQQWQIAARLHAVGCCPEVGQAHLQARGRERGQVLAELQRAEAELEQYKGLPADMGAARAATLEKRQELEALRRRLQEHLNAMQ